MSKIIDGMAVNALNTNAAFLYKDTDDVQLAKLGLNDQTIGDTTSGTNVVNSQREFNSLWSFLGGSLNQIKTYLPTWTTSFFGTSTNTMKERIDAIDLDFSSGKMAYRSGNTNIINGSSTVTVAFSSDLPNASYNPVFSVQNLLDSEPIFLIGLVTSKSVSGFVITFNAAADSANYYVNYSTRFSI